MKIFQTWKSKDPETFTPIYKYCYGSWQAIHPDWEYQLYDDADIDLYCKKNFPHYYSQFVNLPRSILRADLVRYMFMYVEGGLFVDMDFMALKHHSEIIKKAENYDIVFGTLTDSTRDGYIPNAWIMSLKPKNTFWLNVLGVGFSRCRLNMLTVESMTGPDLIRDCIARFKPPNLLLLPPNDVYPCDWYNQEEYKELQKWILEGKPISIPDSYAITFWNHNW